MQKENPQQQPQSIESTQELPQAQKSSKWKIISIILVLILVSTLVLFLFQQKRQNEKFRDLSLSNQQIMVEPTVEVNVNSDENKWSMYKNTVHGFSYMCPNSSTQNIELDSGDGKVKPVSQGICYQDQNQVRFSVLEQNMPIDTEDGVWLKEFVLGSTSKKLVIKGFNENYFNQIVETVKIGDSYLLELEKETLTLSCVVRNSEKISQWVQCENKNSGFQIHYPGEASINFPSDGGPEMLGITFTGTKQPEDASDMVDGYAVSIFKIGQITKSLDSYAKEKYERMKVGYEGDNECEISNIHNTIFNGYEARKYTTGACYTLNGSDEVYYVDVNRVIYEIAISLDGSEIDKQGYKKITDKILSNLTLVK